MQEILSFFQNFVETYWGTCVYQGIFYIALLFVVLHEKKWERKLMYGWYPLILLVIIFNPITVKLVTVFFNEKSYTAYYFRLFSFMPMMCIMAYGLVLLICDQKEVKKFLLVIFLFAVIMIGGNYIYSADWMEKAENTNKIPNAAIQICSIVHSEEKDVKIAVPTDISSYIRQYDASILMPYGRVVKGWDDILCSDTPNVEDILKRAKSEACDYVVVAYSAETYQAFLQWGLDAYGQADSYLIYEVKGVPGIIREYNEKKQIASTTFVDADNNPILGENGYATVKYQYDQYGKNIYEAYYDIEGNAMNVSGGYAGIKRQYNKDYNIHKATYVDENGNPKLGKTGYASVIYEYNQDNRVSYEYYLDEMDEPIKVSGYYGRTIQYNEKNQIEKVTYVDKNRKPIKMDLGYAAISYEYNSAGKIAKEWYFDTEGNPTTVADGYCGLQKEYDANGNITKQTYLNADGTLCLLNSGYAVLCREWDQNGRKSYEYYLDEKNQPVMIKNIYYGLKWEYSEDGNISSVNYVDESGEPMTIDGFYASVQFQYDSEGRRAKETYYDLDGKPVANASGFYGILYQYDANGYVNEKQFLNASGNVTNCKDGYASVCMDNDEKGNVLFEWYLNTNRQRTERNGYYKVKKTYDKNNRVTEVTYLDKQNKETETAYGYAKVQYQYSEDGVLEKTIYIDLSGKKTPTETDSRGVDRIGAGYVDNYWVLSNYKDESGNQGMFYTLKNEQTGELIVVDSGWKENAGQVRKVINELGGHVDAWFITHFDNDHVDAFNEIYEDPQGITVDRIYITPLDYDYYMTKIRDWDTPESYEKFLEITKGNDNVIKLKRGDRFEVGRLQIDVFNAYDWQVVENGSGDLPNYASLVFKITGKKDSILFCGDCHGEQMGQLLQEQYGKEMVAEYAQLGHHGNNSFLLDFYENAEIKYALFDAPEWLMTDEQYTAAALKKDLKREHVQCFDFQKDTVHTFWFR